MIVKVRTISGDEIHFQSKDTPVMIVFERNELELVRNGKPDMSRFLCYDDRVMTKEQAAKWIKERP